MYALFKGETRVGNTRQHLHRCFADAKLHHGLVRIEGDEQLLNGVSPTKVDKDGAWGLLAGFSIREVEPLKGEFHPTGLKWQEIEMDQITPRMDGTPLERALFRIKALREALKDIQITDAMVSPTAISKFASNALAIDDGRSDDVWQKIAENRAIAERED